MSLIEELEKNFQTGVDTTAMSTPKVDLDALEAAYQRSGRDSRPDPVGRPEISMGNAASRLESLGIVPQAPYPMSPETARVAADALPDTMAGYTLDKEGAGQAGLDLARGVGQVATAPARALLSASKALWALGMWPVSRLIPEDAQMPGMPGKTIRDVVLTDQLKGLDELKELLSFADEPYTELSVPIGAAAGAGLRAIREAGRPAMALARRAGITEPLATTAAKTGASAAIGDALVVDPGLSFIEKELMASDLDSGTKTAIAIAAPLVLGLVSGASIEAKIDRVLRNPLAVGFFEGLAQKGPTGRQVYAKFKDAIDGQGEPSGFSKLAKAEEEIRAPDTRPPKERLYPEDRLADVVDRSMETAGKSARQSAEVFERAFQEQSRAKGRLYPEDRLADVVDRSMETAGKSARQSAADIAAESELFYNQLYRQRIPEAERHAAQHKENVRMIGDAAAGRAPSAVQADRTVLQSKLDEIANAGGKPINQLSPEELLRMRTQFAHSGREDLLKIIDQQVEINRSRAKQQRQRQQKPKGETLRWRIMQMGGIDFLHFAGEAKNIPPMVKRSVARRAGTPIDLAERQLQDEGWLDPGEDLMELLRSDPDALRRRHPDNFSQQTDHLTGRQRRMQQELAFEPEMPEGFERLPGHLQAKVAAGGMGMDEALALANQRQRDPVDELSDFFDQQAVRDDSVVYKKSGQDYSAREIGTNRTVARTESGWHEIKEPTYKQSQFEFAFKPETKEKSSAVSDLPPDAQQTRMATTGRLRAGSAKVRSAGEAAKLLAHIRKSAQELFYTITTDNDGNVLEIHRYSKGMRASSQVSPTEVAGRILNIPGARHAYFVHNHPSGRPAPSGAGGDLDIHARLERIVALRDITPISMLIADRKYKVFTHGEQMPTEAIQPSRRNVELPEKERFLKTSGQPGRKALQGTDAVDVIQEKYGGREGFLFLDNLGRDVGFMPYPEGKSMAAGAADVYGRAERTGAAMIVFNSKRPLTERQGREAFVRRLRKALTGDVELVDVIEAGKSRFDAGTQFRRAADHRDVVRSVGNLNSETVLQMHPSTITGPLGGLAAGVDWQELDKSGDVVIDPKKAVVGAIVGAAGPGGYKLARRMMTAWDERVAKPWLDKARENIKGLIVNEELRHALGLNRSKEFGDMLRNHHRDVERSWQQAAQFGQRLAQIAPSKLEQRRLMQIIRGGVTTNPVWRKKADEAREIFDELRKQLKEHKLLEYSRFDGLTRKQRAKLRKIIARDMQERKIHEEEFYSAHGVTPSGFDDEFVADPKKMEFDLFGQKDGLPEHATMRVPLDAYNQKPKSSAQWAREKLHDHYHFASAQEYAPIYYDKHEGLTPKQRQALQDEIKRLKVQSRRGHPEGVQHMEAMIAELEQMLGEGYRARRAMRRSHMELNRRYSHRRIEMPEEVQKILGRIEEAPFPVAKMMGVQKTDVFKGRLFDEIAGKSEWAIPGRIKDPVTGEMVKVNNQNMPANYIKVDDDRFGALDGMHVRKDIWEDLREIEEWRSGFVRLWDKTLGAWKFGKVVLNPATHARNTMSNMILAYFGDVSPADVKTYARAAKALKAGEDDKYYKAAADWGLYNNTFVSSEIGKLRDELNDLRDGHAVKKWMRKALSLPAEVYQGNEKFFKTAAFIKARRAGNSVDAAARKAEKYLFNYADIPPWVKHMKRWVSPFFTFTYKAMPIFAEMAIRKPWKVAAVAGSMYGLERYARHRLGISDQEADTERRLLPAWQQRKTLGVGPYNHVLMPFQDKWGNNLYMDFSYILPYGNLGEKWGQSALPLSDLLPSNPLFGIAAAIMTNQDAFTGREIYNTVLDGAGQIAAKYLDYAWKEAAPSLAPGGHGFNKLKTGIQNTFMGKDVRDWADRPMEFHTAVLSSLMGVKLSPANQRKLKQFELTTRRRIAREVSKEIGRLRVKLRRNQITRDEFKRQSKQLKELERKLLRERPKPE